MNPFDLPPDHRAMLWNTVQTELESYYAQTSQLPAAPLLNKEEIRAQARKFDFSEPLDSDSALTHVLDSLKAYQVHTPHPSYYGLFNPRANFPSILGDLIAATFNPQLAAWSHSPFASEVEHYLVESFAQKFGYPEGETDGVFCSGGAEANQTAILCALNHHFPNFASSGLRSLTKQPVLYCSADAHHSVAKAARTSGLGLEAVREIPMDSTLRMNPHLLRQRITEDLKEGLAPFLVVATAGTTGPGAIDPLPEVGSLCQEFKLWFHADAAYGGALALHPGYKSYLAGIEQSHSITFDIHKWLSVPMGASLLMTRNLEILHQTFRITADYMPKEASAMAVTDPYTHSIQWSRRFIGLKCYLPLLVFGWEGMETLVERQIHSGKYLKEQLNQRGWEIVNPTPMPIACFSHPDYFKEAGAVEVFCKSIVASGKAWISVYPIKGQLYLRACITNYATEKQHLDQLVRLLNTSLESREKLAFKLSDL